MELHHLPDNFQVPLATEDACEFSVKSVSQQFRHIFVNRISIHLTDYLRFASNDTGENVQPNRTGFGLLSHLQAKPCLNAIILLRKKSDPLIDLGPSCASAPGYTEITGQARRRLPLPPPACCISHHSHA